MMQACNVECDLVFCIMQENSRSINLIRVIYLHAVLATLCTHCT